MTGALSDPVRRPRPLPEGEPLSAEDHRRVLGVLESVDRASDLPEFRERLIHALRTWFGFTGVAVRHGSSLPEALREGCGVLGGYTPEFLTEYEERWVNSDPLRSEHTANLLTSRGVARLSDIAPDSTFLRDFLRPNGITDKAVMVVDAGPAGVVFVGMAVCDAPRVPERDLAVLHTLRRHLTPLVAAQLSRDHDRRAVGANWQLTPREWDVADLAAQGLTNRQIAERLFIGVDTVKKHLTRVLAETSCTSRTQLALRFAAA
ncbi:helix-turn-helix transcriptional regulator [Nocardia huaxiensis]|uniref:helix-turn-helix transcriptional regulator n=1 Tax=Nocardia huaxiensis TaxID=2755382 RepID=UPI001E2E96CE|nr:LuxR C-terminal-related transcriptional regulator [Nocardia huaxiensis]UFS93205.1 LuxR C-terminal-related transcriptional regulator [Nocardia huaxiensis]